MDLGTLGLGCIAYPRSPLGLVQLLFALALGEENNRNPAAHPRGWCSFSSCPFQYRFAVEATVFEEALFFFSILAALFCFLTLVETRPTVWNAGAVTHWHLTLCLYTERAFLPAGCRVPAVCSGLHREKGNAVGTMAYPTGHRSAGTPLRPLLRLDPAIPVFELAVSYRIVIPFLPSTWPMIFRDLTGGGDAQGDTS